MIVSNFKTMADRFPDLTRKNCNSLRKMPKLRTQRKALRPALLFRPHGLKKNWISPDIVSYEAKELDEKFQRLFAQARKKEGSDYEPDSLRVMIASLDRHLKEAGSNLNISIAEDREFVNSRKVLEGKVRFLREQGCKPYQLRVTKVRNFFAL